MHFKRVFALIFMIMMLIGSAFSETAALPWDDSPGADPKPEGYISDNEYKDESLHIRIETGRIHETEYWIARVSLRDPSQLRTISANGYQSQRTISSLAMATRAKAVLATNSDYFSFFDDGFLIRQGSLYRNLPNAKRDVLLIDKKGDFHILLKADAVSVAPYLTGDIANSFNFGPALVIDGQVVTKFVDENNAALQGRQRMCLAQVQKGKLEYLCIACAGPKKENSGMTLEQFAAFVHSLGVDNAYNMDGGNSTQLIFRNDYVNKIHQSTMRPLSDIIYFASTAGLPSAEGGIK